MTAQNRYVVAHYDSNGTPYGIVGDQVKTLEKALKSREGKSDPGCREGAHEYRIFRLEPTVWTYETPRDTPEDA